MASLIRFTTMSYLPAVLRAMSLIFHKTANVNGHDWSMVRHTPTVKLFPIAELVWPELRSDIFYLVFLFLKKIHRSSRE